jgi:hypothetical protein
MIFAKSKELFIYQDNNLVGKINVQQFESLVQGAEKYKEIIEAQRSNRVTIKVLDKVQKTEIEGQYKAKVKIIWINKNNNEINFILIDMILNIDKNKTIPEWKILYKEIASVAFPITFALLLIILCL